MNRGEAITSRISDVLLAVMLMALLYCLMFTLACMIKEAICEADNGVEDCKITYIPKDVNDGE